MKTYLILALAIITNAGANIVLKIGMNKAGNININSLTDIFEKFVSNVFVWLGVLLFAIALLSYSYVLTKLQLSIAYPIMTSVGFLIVILISLLYLGEKLSLLQIGGIGLITLGVWLVSSSL